MLSSSHIVVVWEIIFFSSSYSSELFEEVTLVTAFFDIGRCNYGKTPRTHYVVSKSRSDYFDDFKKIAKFKNDLVVFCQSATDQQELFQIRKNCRLENRTQILIIDDFFSVEKNMYDKMVKISENSFFLDFMDSEGVRESKAGYNYVTNLKSYFLNRANLELKLKTEIIAWIDFGFSHGGDVFPFDQDWSFSLKCQICDKIMLWFLPPILDERPIFDVIRTVLPESLMGGFFVCPRRLTNELWKIVRECVFSLLDIGLMDDDQTVFLMASRIKPELFELRGSFWHMPIKQYCNGKHLREHERFRSSMKKQSEWRNMNLLEVLKGKIFFLTTPLDRKKKKPVKEEQKKMMKLNK